MWRFDMTTNVMITGGEFIGCEATRNEVIEYLLKSSDRQKTALTKKLVLPDILPEDLDQPRILIGKRRPRRRSEQKIEKVEVIQ